MSPEDAEEFTQTVESIGSGWWRQIAWADRQGIPAALGMSTREWVEHRIGGYVRLAIPERREAVAELTANGMTQREVADVLGVSDSTVARDLPAPDEAEDTDMPRTAAPSEAAPEPTPEEIEQAERDCERREAIARQVNRLLNLLDGWETVTHLNVNPLRVDVLDAIGDFDRRRVLSIEEVIHS